MRRSRMLLSGLVAAVLALALAGAASAHVTVEPREATANAFQRYLVRVPTEKDVPTVKVRLEFPSEVTVSRFLPKAGWQREVEKDSAGKIVAVTWSGGRIAPDEFEEFGFLARNPANPGKIAWKAYQTYEDGEIVEWTGPEGSDKPASVTTIKAGPATGATSGTVEQPGQTALAAAAPNPASPGQPSSSADWSLFVAIGSGVLAIIALVLSGLGLARRPRSA